MDIGIDRPKQVALLTAIESAIVDIAEGGMTHIEVLGVLELAKLRLFDERLSIDRILND